MKKISILGMIFLLLLLALPGCGNNPPADETTKETIQLFYGDAQNEKMVSEAREISYTPEQDKYQVALEALIQGPENQAYMVNIDQNTKVLGTIQEGSDLIVDLSKEFNTFAGSMAEIMAVGSVVNTMTQFEGIERVKILVQGEELIGPSGNPRGFMTTFPTEPDGQTGNQDETEVTLYFGNQNADKVVGEKRMVPGSPQKDQVEFIKNVLNALIAGPKGNNVFATIPEGVKVQSVTIDQGLLHVDFSEEMHTNHWGGAAGESMTINSIVNTVTEFDFINKVKITVDQSPLAIEHIVLDEPVERNEEMFE
ncbi:GerMN domain-containing protein [Dehalobacterium formicoaceticum]|uniref:GerMN domain-containing protein n=1 Tax=Dehalobacterium formicoaceticum TaxID=51515 RepID=A0ABT1Y5N5_9FIRM|nr:GerMN domain-containing protein [Dehalobacterium formicoaceticum]MCR6546183.1 GerMN domain-containing protein [Dehalobacterium formicoaceticum]